MVAVPDGDDSIETTEGRHSSSDVAFPSTNWSEIRRIVGAEPAVARVALSEWLNRYWRPLYAFFRSQGAQSADAADLTQGLLMQLIERDSLERLQLDSNLRLWLLRMATNFQIDEYRRQNAAKRRPSGNRLPLDEIFAAERARTVDIAADPAVAFQASWRRELLARAFESLRATCVLADQQRDLAVFWSYFVEPLAAQETDGVSHKRTWDQVASQHGLPSGREAARRAEWVKRQVMRLIRTEIRGYVRDESEIDDELRDLLS